MFRLEITGKKIQGKGCKALKEAAQSCGGVTKNVWMWDVRARIFEVSSVCNQAKGKRSKGLFVSLFSFKSKKKSSVWCLARIIHVMKEGKLHKLGLGKNPVFQSHFHIWLRL